jgi:hypothetical protein
MARLVVVAAIWTAMAVALELNNNNGPVIMTTQHTPCRTDATPVLRRSSIDVVERSILAPFAATQSHDGSVPALTPLSNCHFQQHHDRFTALFPSDPTTQRPIMTLKLRQLALDGTPFAHEGIIRPISKKN